MSSKLKGPNHVGGLFPPSKSFYPHHTTRERGVTRAGLGAGRALFQDSRGIHPASPAAFPVIFLYSHPQDHLTQVL